MFFAHPCHLNMSKEMLGYSWHQIFSESGARFAAQITVHCLSFLNLIFDMLTKTEEKISMIFAVRMADKPVHTFI